MRTDLCVHSFAPVLQEMNEKNPKLLSAEAVIVMGIQNLCWSHLEKQNKQLTFLHYTQMHACKRKPCYYLIVFVHGQTNQITEQVFDLILKQTDVCERLSGQIHKLVGIHYLTCLDHQVNFIVMTSTTLDLSNPIYPSSYVPTGAGSPEQTSGYPDADVTIAKMEETAVMKVTLL